MKSSSAKTAKSSLEGVERQSEIYPIAAHMIETGLPRTFVVAAVETARESNGIFRLLKLWSEEADKAERDQLVADIQEVIDDWAQTEKKTLKIDLNDLDAIEKNVQKVKDELRMIADQKGGIKKLSEETGIPVPSLSRFFGTASIPRRLTLLKIKRALNVDKVSIDLPTL